MDSCHNFFPKITVIFTCIIRKLFVVIITGPYCTGIIRGVSHKPNIVISFSSTGFTGYSHIIKLAGGTCTVFDNILHSTCKEISSAFLDYRTLYRGILDQYITVMIQDFGIVNWFDIITAICDRCIGST